MTLNLHPGGKLDDACIWLFDCFRDDPTQTQWLLYFKNGVVFLARTKFLDGMEADYELAHYVSPVAQD